MSSPGHGGHFDSVAPLDRPDGISRTSSRSAACHQACTPRECKGKTAETRALMQLGDAPRTDTRRTETVRSTLAFTGSEDGWLRVAGTRAARRRRRRCDVRPIPRLTNTTQTSSAAAPSGTRESRDSPDTTSAPPPPSCRRTRRRGCSLATHAGHVVFDYSIPLSTPQRAASAMS